MGATAPTEARDIWSPASRLRWLARYNHIPGAPPVLQQMWVCCEIDAHGYVTGQRTEWRDVPTEGV